MFAPMAREQRLAQLLCKFLVALEDRGSVELDALELCEDGSGLNWARVLPVKLWRGRRDDTPDQQDRNGDANQLGFEEPTDHGPRFGQDRCKQTTHH